MRHIQKGPEPPELAAWTSQANDDWQPVYEDLTGADKKGISAALAREQGYLCGYCGSPIGKVEGDCHIEHIISQHECKETGRRHLLTAYKNMLGSCMGTEEPSRVPRHCGAARGTKPVPVTPYLPDCGTYFLFHGDGGIEPSSDPAKREPARETIQNLRLNTAKLRAARAAAIDGALDGLDDLSADEWRTAAAEYDVIGGDGCLMPFCFAVRYVLLTYA